MKSQCYNVVGVTFENRQDILNSFGELGLTIQVEFED